MSLKNTTNQNTNNHLESDWHNCLTRPLGGTVILECQMEVTRCKWAANYRDGRVCKHPSSKQYVVQISRIH